MPSEAVQVIQDLAIVLSVALVTALIAYRLRQPLLVGYLIAGLIVGPYTPPTGLLTHPEILNLFAEVGIVFLLFAVGLEYPLSRLRTIGRTAILIALGESLGTFAAAYAVGRLFGFGEFESLFLGLAVSVTSTLILSKVLEDLGVVREEVAGLVLGITVIEDVVVISALGVLQSLASTGGIALPAVAISIGLVGFFVAVALLLGTRAAPWLLDRVAALRRPDLLLVTLLALAFGLSALSSLLGISVATGAFFAGVLVAGSRSQASARELVAPLKELFGAIFFVSMGALMNFGLLPGYLLPIAVLLAVVLLAKFGITYLLARAQRLSGGFARRTALGLAGPGGEVSLTVVKGGTDIGVVAPFVLPMVGAITLITAVVSSARVRWAWRMPMKQTSE
jgi:monovalent cation:H+ antiporter-2, CPA2 family